ncbi:MAG: thiosulfate oxidation carrier protein SoxY [Betaproteobacteria bacterium]|jgi:sulfur-oxidizing protein SoxY|nr:thiosulfate oxidation carrier protein SoxY [Pseudomonadota bacterium]NBO02756.1 thiosulfate oxidation carrier protein SoxY [Betaproteobacteria bacterium]HAB47520.1 thiosulfate oxidation carrier protein SoxY [Lautropia sp.]NBO95239.1 thiosulfate oxidation carrier protein SoxY [Betaproteobacteria bacterium]NBP34604.1 thiosulfate oxidation carrier protein SoxY [Betaproteobacteria bacterium]
MSFSRREALKGGAGVGLYGAMLALGMIRPGTAQAQAAMQAAFQTKGIPDTLKALGAAGAAESADVSIVSPDIAENGAVVPVGVTSKLPNTDMVALLVDKNPNALAGAYQFLDGGVAEVNMRVKMGQSSDVFAIVRADGKYYMAKKEIKVTLGGCGG